MAEKVYLGLGTNLGERAANLRGAVHALQARPGINVLELSPVYETAPWGIEDQPQFLNMVLVARSELSAAELLDAAKQVERELGREKRERWGPRLIDIDILFFGDQLVEEDGLVVPHPYLGERVFVLAPLADVAPRLVHPHTGQTVAQMLSQVDHGCRVGRSEVRRLPLPLEWGWHTYVMGIVNVTPDSFSGDGILQREAWLEAAVQQACHFVRDGADILDVGGESTRPGSVPVSPEEELARVVPVIEALRKEVHVPISIDTYRAPVAEAALAAGADWVNDVWGLRMDPDLGPLVAATGCPIVLMHNRSRPKSVEQEERLGGRYVGIRYDNLVEDVRRELQESIDLALQQGIAQDRIIIDPGIGFGKTVSQNVQLLDELHHLRDLGYPILLGTSRKSFIGYTLDLPPEERMEGTAATVAIGIDRGADIVRVHDVKAIKRVARMTDRIVRRGRRPGHDQS